MVEASMRRRTEPQSSNGSGSISATSTTDAGGPGSCAGAASIFVPSFRRTSHMEPVPTG